jgi:hypothetical protein
VACQPQLVSLIFSEFLPFRTFVRLFLSREVSVPEHPRRGLPGQSGSEFPTLPAEQFVRHCLSEQCPFGVLLVDEGLGAADCWVEGTDVTTGSGGGTLDVGLTILEVLLTSNHFIGRNEKDFTGLWP